MNQKLQFSGVLFVSLSFLFSLIGSFSGFSYAESPIAKSIYHSADLDKDYKINLTELLRVIQFFNSRSYHCDSTSEDGYAPGPGDQTCTPHSSDYEPNTPWRISLNELLRLVQFYNVCGYEVDPSKEDGFRPVLCPVVIEGEPEGAPEGSLEGSTEGEGISEGEGESYKYARIVIDRRDSVPDTEVNIPLTLETKNVALGYVQFDLIFNSNRISYMDYMIGPAIQSTGRDLSVGQILPGKIRLTTTGTSSTGMTSGIYAILRFKVSDKADFNDIYSIYAESITAIDYPDGQIYPLSVLAGYIRIYSSFPYPPTADFSATPIKNIVNSEVEFRDESRMGNGTDPVWQWNFGDGSFSFQRNPTHLYQSPGVYTVTLTVTTSAGQSVKTKTNYIEIIEGSRIYVKKPPQGQNLNPEPDGLSWETAFPTIQEGIDKAYLLGGGEVWVSAGDYDEVRDNPYGALVLRELVNVYGGFQGTETQLNQRNPQTNITIINGSTARNGQPAWHVVIGENYSELNGFIIKGGDARYDVVYSDAQDGAGLYVPGKKMAVKNCSFFQNKAVGVGAGICCISGKLSIYNCNFIENKIENISSATTYNYGSALYISDSVVNIQNSRFESNSISSRGIWQTSTQNITVVSAGGGIFAYNSSLSIEKCDFYSNTCSAEGVGDGIVSGRLYGAYARALGGAIYLWYSSMTLKSSDFRNNSVSTNDHNGFSRASAGMIYMTRSSGKIINSIGFRNKAYDFSSSNERTGGIHVDLCENVIISNCTFYDNQIDLTTNSHGGALFNYYSNVSFANTIIWQNSGQGTYSLGNDAIFLYCNTQQQKDGEGNISSDPLFIFASAGNFRLSSNSPCIDRGMDTSADEWGNVLTDIEGNMRGRDAIPGVSGDGSEYDIGAYEY